MVTGEKWKPDKVPLYTGGAVCLADHLQTETNYRLSTSPTFVRSASTIWSGQSGHRR